MKHSDAERASETRTLLVQRNQNLHSNNHTVEHNQKMHDASLQSSFHWEMILE